MSKKPVPLPPLDDWLTKQEAARLLAVAEKTIERMADRGEIQKVSRKRPGLPSQVVYHPADLERIRASRDRLPAPFVMPDGQVSDVSKLPTSGEALVRVLTAIADRVAPPLPAGELREPHFLTLKQAAAVSGFPQTFLRKRFILSGQAVKTGGGWRIRRIDLERLAVGPMSDVSDKPT